MKLKLITWLLIAFFLKQIVWLGIIPIWHFPDEEQHFSQTAFFAEKGRRPSGAEADVSREIDRSSELLGTKRSGSGTNKFTYHPEFRIPYTKTQTGVFEQEIADLNNQESRQTMVKHEAARYGPVYYLLTALVYKLFDFYNLFVRLFAARFISVILACFTVAAAYLISKQIFSDQLSRLTLTFMVGFQPMFSFISSGVNSDNLFNLVFTLFLYFCLRVFFSPEEKVLSSNIFKAGKILGLGAVLILGYYTKEQIFISLPILAFAFSLSLLKPGTKSRLQKIIILLVMGGLFLFLAPGRIAIPEYNPQGVSKLKETFLQYIFWHLRHTIAETIPWYWGVFNWLGVTLPRWVNQVQARLLILSVPGFFLFLLGQIRKKEFLSLKNLRLYFLFGSAAIYYFSIIVWDYFFRQTQGFSFGIQGRYFFPTIVPHLLLLLVGLKTLIPARFKAVFLKLFLLWWTAFSLIGLYTATSAYYKTWPLTAFLTQVSQYKPLLFKSWGISISIGLFLTSLIVLLFKLLKLNEKQTS